MSIFIKGRNRVRRRVLINNIAAADVIPVPRGATNVKVYAENRTALGSASISAGNAVGGAQFAAVTAVANNTIVSVPRVAGSEDIVYQADGFIYLTSTVAGRLQVVVTFDELIESLPLTTTTGSYVNQQQDPSAH